MPRAGLAAPTSYVIHDLEGALARDLAAEQRQEDHVAARGLVLELERLSHRDVAGNVRGRGLPAHGELLL